MKAFRAWVVLVLVLLVCVIASGVSVVWASETLTVHLRFHPDKLGASTNLTATGAFHGLGGGVPSPITQVVAYLPAGLKMNLEGATSCSALKLELNGPSACPARSRIGFGGGMGLLELGKEMVHEPFTLDLFLGARRNGHMVVLGYVNATSPASVQFVVRAEEFRAARPYGIGFRIQVPPIPTLPGASNASVESAFITVGDRNVAYFVTVHGKRRLVHLKGIEVPDRCPVAGFPYKALVSFEDGTSLTNTGTISCPKGR